MQRIALVSVTLNAVNPMTEYLAGKPDIHIVNYLDSYILEKVRKEGKVTDDCMRRMVTMISHACEDGADGIIITCTIFSAYVPYFQKMFSVPIVGADVAMMNMVGQKGGRTAMICTFEGTKEPSTNLLKSYFEKYEKNYEIVPIVLNDAYEAAQNLQIDKHNKLIREKVLEIEKNFDNIVLAQISMAGAALGIKLNHATLFTSPNAAYETLMQDFKRQ